MDTKLIHVNVNIHKFNSWVQARNLDNYSERIRELIELDSNISEEKEDIIKIENEIKELNNKIETFSNEVLKLKAKKSFILNENKKEEEEKLKKDKAFNKFFREELLE